MTGHVKVSGAWKSLASDGVSVKVSGAWKTVANAYVRVSGSWKEWYSNAGPMIVSGGGWSGVSTTWPSTTSSSTGAATVTWTGGGARVVSITATSFSYEHSKNGGAWTSGDATAVSGDTLAWRFVGVTGPDASDNACQVYDATLGSNVGSTFVHTWTGFP